MTINLRNLNLAQYNCASWFCQLYTNLDIYLKREWISLEKYQLPPSNWAIDKSVGEFS